MVYRGSLVRTSNHALASSAAANKHCDALCQVVAQIAADPTNNLVIGFKLATSLRADLNHFWTFC